MDTIIRILHLEDDPQDAELIRVFLESKDVECEINLVNNEHDYRRALESPSIDIIFSDYRLPAFDGTAALKIAQETCPDIPVIFISGTLGEEPAIEALLSGATDYVMKQKLSRLLPAIQRAMTLVKERRERKQAEDALKQKTALLEAQLNSSLDGILVVDNQGKKILQNQRTVELWKIPEEIANNSDDQMQIQYVMSLTKKPDEFVQKIQYLYTHQHETSRDEVELTNGTILDRYSAPVIGVDGHKYGRIWSFRDITERKRAVEALQESEIKYRDMVEQINDVLFTTDINGRFTYVSPTVEVLSGYTQSDLVGHLMYEFLDPGFLPRIKEQFQKVLKGNLEPTEYRVRNKGGELKWVRSSSRPILENGRPVGMRGVLTDISAQKIAEESLLESEERYRTLVEVSPDVIFTTSEDGTITSLNTAFETIVGFPRGEWIGRSYSSLLHPDDVEESKRRFIQVLHGEVQEPHEMRMLSKSGAYLTGEFTSAPYIHDGKIVGMHGIARDITKRKLNEQKITKLNRTYAMLSNINKLIVHERDRQKLLDRACTISIEYGKFQMIWIGLIDETNGSIHLSAHAGIENTYLDDMHQIKVNTMEREAPSTKAMIDARYVIFNDLEHMQQKGLWQERALALGYKSSASFALRVSSKIIGAINYYSNEPEYFDKDEIALLEELAMDISFAIESIEIEKKRRQAEETLAQEQYLMNMLMNNTPDHIYFKDINSRFLRVSKSQSEKFNLSGPDQAIGKSDFSFFSEEHARHAFRDEQGIITTGKPIVNIEEKETWPDGQETWVLTTKEPLRDKRGKIIGTFGISRDITERKRGEEALLLQNIALQSAANAILITDCKGKIIFANRAFSQFTGYSLEEVIGKNPNILKSGKQSDKFYKNLWDTILSGIVWKGELENKRKDGITYTEEMTITPVYQAGGEISHFIAIKQDVTEQKKLQNQIFQTQKVQSIGTLAGGIAHDFNNILGIIMAFTSILEKSNGDMQKIAKGTSAITQAVNRGAALTHQILTFARQTGMSVGAMSIPVLIKELLVMLKETFPTTIEFQTHIEKDIPLINADSSQMHQVLLNICVNARDAMPKGGTIEINVSLVSLNEVIQRFPQAENDRYIFLSISDTGIGMDEITKSRIFDPFFTTKELGKGTGLGLSVVYGAIQSHHGFITVKSEPGKGTTFLLYLPVPLESKNQKETLKSEVKLMQGGSETILVVEDEELLREALQSSLESNGYKVVLAVDGREAVDIYHERYKEIALVLSDIGLPKLNGVDVFSRLKEINPKVRVVFASGFISVDSRTELLKGGVKEFIQKPYLMDEVFQVVRAILDKNEG
jgi:PAS domain S-box-containing protein